MVQPGGAVDRCVKASSRRYVHEADPVIGGEDLFEMSERVMLYDAPSSACGR